VPPASDVQRLQLLKRRQRRFHELLLLAASLQVAGDRHNRLVDCPQLCPEIVQLADHAALDATDNSLASRFSVKSASTGRLRSQRVN
jgi:hypothetical protein